jgi:hypothetical protein
VSATANADHVELELAEAIQGRETSGGCNLPYLLLEAPAGRPVEVRWHSTLVTEVPTRVE